MSTYLVTVVGQTATGLRTYRWSTGTGYVDGDRNVYDPAVIDPGSFVRALIRQGATYGQSQVGYGTVVINNADGELDDLIDVAFDGRRILIADTTGRVYLDGTVGGVEFRRREIVFRIRDRQALVGDLLIETATFAGTNVLPDGFEGTANDIGGVVEPRAWGVLRGIALPMVNTSRNIFQISTGPIASVNQVQDGGAAITAGSVYATLADVQSVAPAGATYRPFLGSATEASYLRTGSDPVRILTADVTEGAVAADRTVAQIMRRILRRVGLTALDIEGDAAVDSIAPWTGGFFCPAGEPTTVKVALDALAASIHGFWIGTRTGKVRIGILRPPAGIPVLTLTQDDIAENGTSLDRIVTEGEGLPVWRVTVRYQRNWTPQSRDQLAGVAKAEQERLGQAARSIVREDATIKARHPLATELVVETVLDTLADATALRDAVWSCYSVQRDVFAVGVAPDLAADLELNDVVSLNVPRFGLASGRLFRVIGIDQQIRRGTAILTLWG
ncbi:MAG: hypothetical protein ACK53W_12595 [Gemmatimonadota bacterium]